MLLLVFLILCTVGLLISSYFTALSYQWIQPDTSWIPSFCRLGEQTCTRIIFTPRARVFGVPNSLLGQFFYLATLVAAVTDLLLVKPFYYFFLVASSMTVVLAVYLSYSLLFLTRVPCKLCFTSHAINVVIFVLLLILAP